MRMEAAKLAISQYSTQKSKTGNRFNALIILGDDVNNISYRHGYDIPARMYEDSLITWTQNARSDVNENGWLTAFAF